MTCKRFIRVKTGCPQQRDQALAPSYPKLHRNPRSPYVDWHKSKWLMLQTLWSHCQSLQLYPFNKMKLLANLISYTYALTQLTTMSDCLNCISGSKYTCKMSFSDTTSFCCSSTDTSSACSTTNDHVCSSNLAISQVKQMVCPLETATCGS